jgi:hypothetical protein
MAVVGNGEPAKRFAAAESELATTMQDIRGCMMYGLFKNIKACNRFRLSSPSRRLVNSRIPAGNEAKYGA